MSATSLSVPASESFERSVTLQLVWLVQASAVQELKRVNAELVQPLQHVMQRYHLNGGYWRQQTSEQLNALYTAVTPKMT